MTTPTPEPTMDDIELPPLPNPNDPQVFGYTSADLKAYARAAIAADRAKGGDGSAMLLSNLLARIHRDGGHHEADHGTEPSVRAADKKVLAWLARDDSTPAPETRQGLSEALRTDSWAPLFHEKRSALLDADEFRDEHESYIAADYFREGWEYASAVALSTSPAPTQDAEQAAMYRWLRENARVTSEHWGGRWSMVIEGPAPANKGEMHVDDAIRAAMKREGAK